MKFEVYHKADKRVKPKYECVDCNRCGQCCENMAVSVSPEDFKKAYLNWVNGRKKGIQYTDSHLLYPMLTYLGYDKKVKKHRYKCKHFTRDKTGLGVCTIYNIRPAFPCIDFGRDEARGLRLCSKPGKGNKKLYPECVF